MTSLSFMPNQAEHILVASPNPGVRQKVLESLRSSVQRVEQASGGAEALGHLESGSWQVLYLDRALPDLNAEELSRTIQHRFPGIEVVLFDDGDTSGGVVEEKADLTSLCRRVGPLLNPAANVANEPGRNEPGRNEPLPGMIGTSHSMQPVYRAARLLAQRDTTVLVTGPTGCGKELVARAIHSLSPRAKRAFVVVNCAAIPEALLESELFGHTRCAERGLKRRSAKKERP